MMNWEIGIDMYTVICIKLMTNKDLPYKKINKIKLKKEYIMTVSPVLLLVSKSVLSSINIGLPVFF